MLLITVAMLFFSCLVYFVEKDTVREDGHTWTLYDSFSWGLMTMTTVGNVGGMTPQTYFGKFLGGLCAISGVFILTLPIPIVVNSFASYYKNRLWRNEVAHKKAMRTEQLREIKEFAHLKLLGASVTASTLASTAGVNVTDTLLH